jgi:hypothetical protein
MIAISGAILFVLLTPGLLLRIPSNGPLLTASIVHAIVFGILFYFISMMLYSSYNMESFINNSPKLCEKIDELKNNLGNFGNSLGTEKLSNDQLNLYIKSLGILSDIDQSECK